MASELKRNPDFFFPLVFVPCCPGASHSNSSTSLQTGASGFGGSKDGMHQRSFSVSSADQWNEAINTSTSSGAGTAQSNLVRPKEEFSALCGTTPSPEGGAKWNRRFDTEGHCAIMLTSIGRTSLGKQRSSQWLPCESTNRA